MSSSADYRRYARNCLDLSRLYRAPSHSALLVEMAEAWDRLARQAEGTGEAAADAGPAAVRAHSRLGVA
jgi:hypothetical protein